MLRPTKTQFLGGCVAKPGRASLGEHFDVMSNDVRVTIAYITGLSDHSWQYSTTTSTGCGNLAEFRFILVC